ncbi:MAG: GYF domain-containing protein [Myxococcales bacterium]|nr:zinc-ribbon domain-containing protein [Polyangiaceae bacterium]MDW8247904.1 GYF domain-containing protein [Myxococcales bacterium]
MKFLCDNCKAKYQIADDKVAGKTVRMKCRKCGHLIEIRATAALAEATAFRSLPTEELSRIIEEPLTQQPSAGPSKPSAAPQPTPRPAAGVAASASVPKPTSAAAPPRPGTSASARAVARGSSAVALAPAKPAPQEQPEAVPAPKNSASGLASAFARSVVADPPREEMAPPSTFDMSDNEGAEEWYAGIGGVPVGPVRLSELRTKISSGQVTEETLVWREGFEEWVALRTVPALVELVRSLRPTNQAALAGRSSGKMEKGNVVALRQESKPINDNDEATTIFSGRAVFGTFGEKPTEASSSPTATPPQAASSAPVTVSDPFAAPDPFAVSAPSASPSPSLPVPASLTPEPANFPPPAPAPNRIPPVAWVVVVLALAVGLLGGTMLVPKEKAQTEVQIVTIEKVVSSPAPEANTTTSEILPSTPDASPSTKKVALVPGSLPKATAVASATAPTATSVAALAGPLPTINTPAPPTNDAPPTSTETIPAGKLQEIVNSHRTSIRRTCWDPIVASGAASGSVKVTVTLTIVAGRVTTISVGGADGRLSGCIQGRVRGWQFPTGFAPTTTSFTLAFVAQG